MIDVAPDPQHRNPQHASPVQRSNGSDDARIGSETQGARLAADATPTVEHPAAWAPVSVDTVVSHPPTEAAWAPVSALAHRASTQWAPRHWSAEYGS